MAHAPQSRRPERTVSRVTTALGLVLLVAITGAAAIVFLVAVGLLSPEQIVRSSVARQLFAPVEAARHLTRLAWAAGAFGVGLLALGLLILPLTSRGRGSSLHMVTVDDRGFVVIDSRGIAAVAARAAESAHGVVGADVQVQGNGTSAVRLRIDVGVYPGAAVKRAGDEARTKALEAVEELVGIGVRDVTVAVHVVETDELARMIQ